jgi:hypothetical protein
MNLPPVVRYIILCEDARFEGDDVKRLNIHGLTLRLRSDSGNFPARFPQLCTFLVFANGRGKGTGAVTCIHDDTDLVCWRTPPQTLKFFANPLGLRGAYFRVTNPIFPEPGAYTIEFRYNGVVLASQSLIVEGKR